MRISFDKEPPFGNRRSIPRSGPVHRHPVAGREKRREILKAAVFSDRVDTGRLGFQGRLAAEISRRTDVLPLKQGLATPDLIEARGRKAG